MGVQKIVGECVKLIHVDIHNSMNTLCGSIQVWSEAWQCSIQVHKARIDITEDARAPEDHVTTTWMITMAASILRSLANSIQEQESNSVNTMEDHEVSIIVDERVHAHPMSSWICTAPSALEQSVLPDICKWEAVILQ